MADYSFVRDETGNACGIWLRDPGALDRPGSVEVFLAMQAPHLMDAYIARKYRKVPNTFDHQGGCFVMFGSAKAPGEASASKTGSSNCFVATAVYGDPFHPSVCILRTWRDSRLAHSLIGRLFIRFYYHFSPHLVGTIKGNRLLERSLHNSGDIIPISSRSMTIIGIMSPDNRNME